jgi:ferredoxin/flavodoxin---NADP+ reductase
MSQFSGEQEQVHIAIIGSGPSGFYAAEALLRSGKNVAVTMIERLPTPFGLVRSGVAPDHPKLKQSILVYERILREENFNFLGNVTVGRDVSVSELRSAHHAVIFASGAQQDRRMGIPGEDFAGSHTATEFVGWYNGHPDFRDRSFDLEQEVAVVVGHGNVAADVCRILAKSVDELRQTDIAEHALEALAQSRIKKIHMIGRRGPVQAKFTPKELRELGEIRGAVACAEHQQCSIAKQCGIELAAPANTAAVKNLALFRSYAEAAQTDAARRIVFQFYASPIELHGTDRVEAVTLSRNKLTGPAFSQSVIPIGITDRIPCGLVFRSIGYRGEPIDGLPFDYKRGVVPNDVGRVVADEAGQPIPGVYVTGWIKRGPTGIIGTNRADSIETVESILADLDRLAAAPKPGHAALRGLLAERGIRTVSIEDWRTIDAREIERGRKSGKPREKFTRVDEMLELLS